MENKLHKILKNLELEDYCESLSLQAYQAGAKVIDYRFGPEYSYYDLASLTKPIFTTTAFIKLCEEDPSVLDLDVGEILGWDHYFKVKVSHLLSHSSGLAWWKPFYESIKNGNWQNRREQMAQLLREEPTQTQDSATYSDLDYLVLGYVLEVLLGKELHSCWMSLNEYFPKNELHFPVVTKKNKKNYAPTFSHQLGTSWVQGVVNDANAQSLGGISSHAGLFGAAEDVSRWCLMLRNSFLKNEGFVKTSTLKKFMKRHFSEGKGDWTLGFMMPSPESSAGKYFSKNSLGHLGFTGTSFWWDPEKDMILVILSNRYIQHKKGENFKNLRPLIHNAVMESLAYE